MRVSKMGMKNVKLSNWADKTKTPCLEEERTRAESSTSIDTDIIPQYFHSSTTILQFWLDKQ